MTNDEAKREIIKSRLHIALSKRAPQCDAPDDFSMLVYRSIALSIHEIIQQSVAEIHPEPSDRRPGASAMIATALSEIFIEDYTQYVAMLCRQTPTSAAAAESVGVAV